MDLLGNLNPPQREAVLHGEGPLLVFAGAGSGKTRVITHRLAHLVRERDVRPWQVLAVTFTNKAAGEMRGRVGQLLGEGIRDTWIGTFHATCARLLRQFADQAGLKRDFVIYDDDDQKSVVTRCLRELNIDERRIAPRAVQSRIQQAKQECVSAGEYQPGNYFEDQVAKVYRRYEEYMLAAGALDFGDLLFLMVRLVEHDASVMKALQARFRHVLVDEFQDTNYVQYRLLRHLAGEGHNLCVVGDDDQSIYRWRGADVRNILHFQQDFPDTRVVLLEQNYRSSANILAGAMAVIKKNRTRAPKTLWTENPSGDLIQMATLEDERAEAAWVVRNVTERLAGGGSPGDIAVFYRINAQARVIEEALRASNLPYRVFGGVKFYERAEVKDLVGYLRVVHNPDDDVDLVRIINRPARKIGKATVDRLLEIAGAERIGLGEALRRSLSGETFSAATRKRLQAFHELLAGLRDLASTTGPADLAVAVLERTGYLDDLKAQDTPEADTRIENLAELVGSFQDFEREAEEPTLAALLETISLQQDTDAMDEKPKTVTLMTVHSAKGLEFPLVLLTGMEEGMFPYRRANEEVDLNEERERLEEERRLCYVAMTRARDRLALTNVARRRLFGTERYNPPSRFLEDIPDEIVARTGIGVRASRRPAPGSMPLDGWSPRSFGGARRKRRFR
jgi:DNA helicase-2/ATP-dependent DNA helicase PcrA